MIDRRPRYVWGYGELIRRQDAEEALRRMLKKTTGHVFMMTMDKLAEIEGNRAAVYQDDIFPDGPPSANLGPGAVIRCNSLDAANKLEEKK